MTNVNNDGKETSPKTESVVTADKSTDISSTNQTSKDSSNQKPTEPAQKGVTPKTGDLNLGERPTDNVPEILKLVKEISELEKHKSILSKAINEGRALLKPVKKADKKLYGGKGKLTNAQKTALRHDIGENKKKVRAINDKLAELNDKLRKQSIREQEKSAYQELKDKANSITYIRKNEYIIKSKLLDLLNNVIKSDNEILLAAFEKVCSLSFSPIEEGFNKAFADLLKNTDEKIYILCSGRLEKKLYEAAMLTLRAWNKEEKSITRLIFPEDLKSERKTAIDPFINNKAMIESNVIRFLNGELKQNPERVKDLRKLAKDKKEPEKFVQQIETIVDTPESNLQEIYAGGYRSRIIETLKLTFLNWRPDLETEFTRVILAKASTDPLVANKALFESLILSFLNARLEANGAAIKELRILAKNVDKKQEFAISLMKLVNQYDSYLSSFIKGSLGKRVIETIRLTLVLWQPELQGKLEHVEYPLTENSIAAKAGLVDTSVDNQ